ncbi:helicase SEN1-like [Prunus yedoensis var. nudiflora]|uniref:Helicase SEN1-like n=1 Tax=Prunus yedoensis var. nudiflora TaxID=2094558 RepID=A0A314YIX4_PRUYE|nr:helicase SEN1-like [Prunus yedoensis var. nudiflora]
MKIDNYDDLVEVFLDYRIEILAECFNPCTGWKYWLESMIGLLEDPREKYSTRDDENDFQTFEEFVKEKLNSSGEHVEFCMVVTDMIGALDLLNSLKSLLREKVSVGVISPYLAQVNAIQERVREYSEVSGTDGFSVSVQSVDGFQGGEDDVIIISTVRCNEKGYVGFISNLQRANVMRTRARCFCHIAVVHVCFTNEFQNSIQKIKDTEIRREVVSLLTKLSNGWRQSRKNKRTTAHGTCAQVLEKYKVKGLLNLIWSIDVLQENSDYVQVLKIWDVLPVSDTPELDKRLENMFHGYTTAEMNLCLLRCVDGDAVVPIRMPVDSSSSHEAEAEADPVEVLSKPLSSLSLKDEPQTSSSEPESHRRAPSIIYVDLEGCGHYYIIRPEGGGQYQMM